MRQDLLLSKNATVFERGVVRWQTRYGKAESLLYRVCYNGGQFKTVRFVEGDRTVVGTVAKKPAIQVANLAKSFRDKRINTLIKDYAIKRGATVFLCTHQLRYAQDICTHYGFINRGELICTGSFSDILAQGKFKKYLYLHAQLNPDDTSLNDFRVEANKYRVLLTDTEGLSDIVERIVLHGGKVFEAEIHEPSLGDVYFSLVKGKGDFYE